MILRATSPWPLQDAAVMLMQSAFTGRPGYRLGSIIKETDLSVVLAWSKRKHRLFL